MYHIRIICTAFVIFLLVGGCATDLDKVQLGETQDEVRDEMGLPRYRIENETEIVWIYQKGQGGCSTNSEDEYLIVIFDDDVVSEIKSATTLDEYDITTETQ